MYRIPLIILLFFPLMDTSLDPDSGKEAKITIATASSLTLPMEEVKDQFEAQYNIRIELAAASSGVLAAQIIHGAPFDIFISADLQYPQKLHDMGVVSSSPQTVIWGSLVLWSKRLLAGKPQQAFLKEQDIQTVAIANPELAPFGKVAVNWLQEKNIYRKIRPKLIYGESIGSINQFIFSGAVDVAFTSISAMNASQLKSRGYWTLLTHSKTPGIPHGAVLLEHAHADERHLHQSRLFMEYLLSDEAQSVFRQFGYHVTSGAS